MTLSPESLQFLRNLLAQTNLQVGAEGFAEVSRLASAALTELDETMAKGQAQSMLGITE